MTPNEIKLAREFLISKGDSNFCSELILGDDYETMVKQKPDGFYDIICNEDTIEGGIHVIEFSAIEQLQKENERLRIAISNAITEIVDGQYYNAIAALEEANEEQK